MKQLVNINVINSDNYSQVSWSIAYRRYTEVTMCHRGEKRLSEQEIDAIVKNIKDEATLELFRKGYADLKFETEISEGMAFKSSGEDIATLKKRLLDLIEKRKAEQI
jgi:hypothetical protein